MNCEWPTKPACPEPVVAKIGLPRESAIWVCKKHFDQWQSESVAAHD